VAATAVAIKGCALSELRSCDSLSFFLGFSNAGRLEIFFCSPLSSCKSIQR
ncbi:unnamed protein product, partial [Ceratitis capitata]